MTAAATLARLRDLGVAIRADAGVLRLRPASAVPPDLLADLRAHKSDVLALLAANYATAAPTLRPATLEQAADEGDDREAIAAEPLLPPPGTAERVRLDRAHATMLRGLLAAARLPPPPPAETPTELQRNDGAAHEK